MKAILIRVGVDHSYGHWNAPCNPNTRDYAYIPIPQESENAKGYERYYDETAATALRGFSRRNGIEIELPKNLQGKRMHLDPDFDHLSYGDTKNRGKRLLDFTEDDLVLFYSGMRSIFDQPKLEYALIGMYVVKTIQRASDIPSAQYDNNAHTRLQTIDPLDIVVTAKPGLSGRFKKYISIGEFRNRSYRVREDLLEAWVGLSVNDGWIQRSVVPPLFLQPEQFLDWLNWQSAEIVASNL